MAGTKDTPKTMVLEIVKETIRNHRLLEQEDDVLIAFSGGLDSTGLVAVFLELQQEWSFRIFLGHFNHRLRPAAAEDERFVRKTAQQHGLPLYVASEDVRSFARRNKWNLEEAARMLRYAFLEKTAEKIGGAKIATGHTMNDQAETFFMHLMRGSGLKGLASISPFVKGRIIRPLISVEREAVADYLKNKGWAFREDESNLDRRYARNKVRLDLIPYIQENFEPDIVQRIGKTVNILQEEDKLLAKWASQEAEKTVFMKKEKICLDLKSLLALPKGLTRRIARDFIRRVKSDLRGISYQDVESLLSLEEAKCLQLTDKLLLERKNGFVTCRSEPFEKIVYSYRWDGSSALVIDELDLKITAERIKRLPGSSDFDDKERAYFDGNAVLFPLHIRNRQDGDKYRPLGAPGHKKLKEILRAKNIPLADREKRPVFLSGEEIIWVLGLPVAEKFKVCGGTKEVLAISVAPHGQR